MVDGSGTVVGVVVARLNDIWAYRTSGMLPQNVNYAVKGDLLYDFLNNVPELRGKLMPSRRSGRKDAANDAQRATVLVLAK